MLTSRETPRDSLRNMDHVYFFRLVEFSHPQTACRRNRMSTWPHFLAPIKLLCFTQSQGFHFFLARHSSSLICIRVPTNNLSWWSSGHLTPNAKKTTWMFGAKTDPWDLGVEHVTLQILTLSHMNIDKREMLNSKNPEDFDTNCCPSVMQPLVYKTNWLVPFFPSKNPTVKYWYRFTIDLP